MVRPYLEKDGTNALLNPVENGATFHTEHRQMKKLSFRRLSIARATDVSDLAKVLSSAPQYKLPCPGLNATSNEVAGWLMSKIPLQIGQDDKFLFSIYCENSTDAIGVADVVRNWPKNGTAFIGLLLLSESAQGQSIGVAALKDIEILSTSWGCDRLQIAVDSSNPRALAFWTRQGFQELYRKPVSGFVGDAIAMERRGYASDDAMSPQDPKSATLGSV